MPRQPHPADGWAQLRFAIIGPLLAAPPEPGELAAALEALAERHWRHPVQGHAVQFSVPTLERWYYRARGADDPLAALRPRRRGDAGRSRTLSGAHIEALSAQYREHPGWTVQLHYDNLRALAEQDNALADVPSYGTVRRLFRAQGWVRRRLAKRNTPGAHQAEYRLASREVRSYEVEYVHALWHADFHHGSRRILTAAGAWATPLLLGIIDDRSRVVCHLQWYLHETAQTLVHGLSQALQKHGLPRALMTDNGAAMQAEEFQQGLKTLGILHEPTLPYSPYQNAKQESFWATLEGRLMAQLEGVNDLGLGPLNALTQAWLEQEYHRSVHRELATTPLRRYLDERSVGRPAPSSEALRRAFRRIEARRLRRSDCTLSLAGKRYEVPDRYRHLERPLVAYARWDLTQVELLDPNTRLPLCPLYPLDKLTNADGRRRRREPVTDAPQSPATSGELPPLLRKLLAEFAATGLPPAYLPTPDEQENNP
jgi:transposase InsO family protein